MMLPTLWRKAWDPERDGSRGTLQALPPSDLSRLVASMISNPRRVITLLPRCFVSRGLGEKGILFFDMRSYWIGGGGLIGGSCPEWVSGYFGEIGAVDRSSLFTPPIGSGFFENLTFSLIGLFCVTILLKFGGFGTCFMLSLFSVREAQNLLINTNKL